MLTPTLRHHGPVFGKLTPEDKAAIAAWSPPTPARKGVLSWLGVGLMLAVLIVAGLGGGGGDPGVGAMSDLPGGLRRQVKRLRRGRAVTAVLWRRDGENGTPVGPCAVTVRSDLTCRFTPHDRTLDLRGSELISTEPYAGPSPNRFEPVPKTALVARVRLSSGVEVGMIGDASNLAPIGVLCRWPAPLAVAG